MQLCMSTIIIFMVYLILVESTGSEDKIDHTRFVSLDSKAKRKIFRDQLKTFFTKQTNEPERISENLPSRVNSGGLHEHLTGPSRPQVASDLRSHPNFGEFHEHVARPSRPKLASKEIDHMGHGSRDSKATRKIIRRQLKTLSTEQTIKRQRNSESLPSRVNSSGFHEHTNGPSRPQVASDLRSHPNSGGFHEHITAPSRPQVASDLRSHPNFDEFYELLTRSYRHQPPSDLTSHLKFGGYHIDGNPSNIEFPRLSGPSQLGHYQHDPNNHPPQSPPGSPLPPLPESYFDNIPRTAEYGHNYYGK